MPSLPCTSHYNFAFTPVHRSMQAKFSASNASLSLSYLGSERGALLAFESAPRLPLELLPRDCPPPELRVDSLDARAPDDPELSDRVCDPELRAALDDDPLSPLAFVLELLDGGEAVREEEREEVREEAPRSAVDVLPPRDAPFDSVGFAVVSRLVRVGVFSAPLFAPESRPTRVGVFGVFVGVGFVLVFVPDRSAVPVPAGVFSPPVFAPASRLALDGVLAVVAPLRAALLSLRVLFELRALLAVRASGFAFGSLAATTPPPLNSPAFRVAATDGRPLFSDAHCLRSLRAAASCFLCMDVASKCRSRAAASSRVEARALSPPCPPL